MVFSLLLVMAKITYAQCSSPSANTGAINYFGGSTDAYRYCNGSSWVDFPSTTDIGNCSADGEMQYDTSEKAYKFCDGNDVLKINCTVISGCGSPAAPLLAGTERLLIGGNAQGVSNDGNYLYAVSNAFNFAVIDISTPSSPCLTGYIPDDTFAPAVFELTVPPSGNYVAIVTSTGLCSIDVSDPTNPQLGDCDSETYAYDVALDGSGNAYLTRDNSTTYMRECGISTNSVNCHTTGSISTQRAYGIDISGNYAYIAKRASDQIQVVDLTNSMSIHDSLTDAANLTEVRTLKVSGSYLYTVSATADKFVVIDISDPSNIQIAGGGTAVLNLTNAGEDFDISGNYAYVDTAAGIAVIDISDPTSPTLDNTIVTSSNDISITGTTLYTGASPLTRVNISDPTSPSVISSSGGIYTQTTYLNRAESAATSGNHVFAASPYNSGTDYFIAVDYSDPSSPVLADMLSFGVSLDEAYDIDIAGNYAFIAAGSRLVSIDISDPTNMSQADILSGFTLLYDIDIQGSFAYGVDLDADQFIVFDISDPTNLAIANSGSAVITDATNLNRARGIAVSGNYAYIYADSFFTVIDISDPSNPVLETSVSDSTNFNYGGDIAISGNHAFLAARVTSGFVTSVDISNPSSPSVVQRTTDGFGANGAQNIKIAGDYAYVTVPNIDSVLIFDISDPANMTRITNINNTTDMPMNSPQDIAIGSYVYVLSNTSDNIIAFEATSACNDLGSCTQEAELEYDTNISAYKYCDGTSYWQITP